MVLNPASLRELRKARGLTISELARKSGVARTHISNMENGARPLTPGTARRLADALGCSPYALLGPEDPRSAVKELVRIYGLNPLDLFDAKKLRGAVAWEGGAA